LVEAAARQPESRSSNSLLRVERLSKRFGEYQALRDISFEVSGHEIVGLIGPNGAGKTTLMECVSGLLPADSGRVSWNGAPLPTDARKNVMFYLPDEVSLYGAQFVITVLDLFRAAFGASHDRLAAIVDQLELASVLTKRVKALSKGYRRRFLLAIGLLAPQPLLLLDEPFSGFDLRQTLSVIPVLVALREAGRTLVLSIHQLTDAERICDRFILLSAGEVLGCGTLSELRHQAKLETGGLEAVFLALT
jgi:ABC-2 type transport system ATP-binding protein